jgi:hypothetical protein
VPAAILILRCLNRRSGNRLPQRRSDFRSDVTTIGVIDSSEAAVIKTKVGSALPQELILEG